jgi:hypothetical protein
MDPTDRAAGAPRLIDLTNLTDVQFWCRVFDVSMDQLRDAVHHAGHQVEDVERYLRQKNIHASWSVAPEGAGSSKTRSSDAVHAPGPHRP